MPTTSLFSSGGLALVKEGDYAGIIKIDNQFIFFYSLCFTLVLNENLQVIIEYPTLLKGNPLLPIAYPTLPKAYPLVPKGNSMLPIAYQTM